MSFYRTLLAAVAAIALASPVFADETASTTTTENTSETAATADQPASTSKTTTTSTTETTQTKVNLNTATAKELMKVKGLNASKARAIVAYRKKHGDFKSVDELANVKGFAKMKEAKMQAIQNQLSVE